MKYLVTYVINGRVEGAGVERQLEFESESEPVWPNDSALLEAIRKDSYKYSGGTAAGTAGFNVIDISAL